MKNKKQNQNDNLNYLNGGGFAARPKTLLCSICGREFGTASLEIHQKTCIKKYQNDLANMDPGHRMQMPSNHVKIRTRKKLSLIRTKSCQVISFLRITIVGYGVSGSTIILISKCRKCGRRFNPDRIRKHESVCIGPEPDVQRIKQRQEEMNKRAAKQLRPKKTGKWREDHLEFQQAMREMRKIRQQEIAEGRGNPFGNQHGYQQGNYGKSYGNSYGNQGNSYGNSQMNYGRPPSKQQPKNYSKQTQQTTKNIPKQPNYTQSVKVSHKQPNFQLEQQQMKLHSRSPMVQKPVQQQQTRSSVDRGGYGRPANQGGGGASYQIANSNVSTFSLFTSDGLPKRYDNFQANNPYAKKNGLY